VTCRESNSLLAVGWCLAGCVCMVSQSAQLAAAGWTLVALLRCCSTVVDAATPDREAGTLPAHTTGQNGLTSKKTKSVTRPKSAEEGRGYVPHDHGGARAHALPGDRAVGRTERRYCKPPYAALRGLGLRDAGTTHLARLEPPLPTLHSLRGGRPPQTTMRHRRVNARILPRSYPPHGVCGNMVDGELLARY
jgi:hypothetical protein